ncbi:hypothetical protein KJZ99_05450 [bacterium]|nr:hypothetical protein [bacterium]
MNTRKLMWGIAAFGLLAGGFATLANDLERRTKVLWEELLGTASIERQIELKQELARLTLPEERLGPRGRLDQGGENWSNAVILPSNPSITASGTTIGFANDFNVVGLVLPPDPCWTGYFSPSLTCAGPDVAYRYTVPITGSYRVQLCASNFDTGLLLYQYTGGPPNNATDFICGNDDFCGLRSEFTSPTLFAGQEVLLVVDGWNLSAGMYEVAIELIALSIPPNDLCPNATVLEPFVVVSGTTVDATPDPVPDCGTSISAPGVWYLTIGTGNTMSVQTCLGATYDTKLNVYSGSCSLLECVGGNDDACGLQSRVTWCSQAGQPYYILVQGFSGQTGNFTLMIEDDGVTCGGGGPPIYTIPEVYAQRDILVGQDIILLAYATPENMLVADWEAYSTTEKQPPYFGLQLFGGMSIDPIYQDGAWLQLNGTVGEIPSEPDNTINLVFTPINFLTLVPSLPINLANWRPPSWTPSAQCDTCKFAVFISGGWKGTSSTQRGSTGSSNRADYWDDIVDFYCYKRSHGWCENRTKVFYYKGERPTGHSRRTDVPAGVVDSCWESKIQAHFTAISSQIAACKRAGKCPMVEVMVTNHGDPSSGGNQGGITMVHSASGEDTTFTGREFRLAMQQLIDSGLCNLDVEFGQCFSGILVNEVRDSLNTRGCNVTASSATNDQKKTRSRAGDGGYNYWLNAKVCALNEGRSLHEAVNIANRTYDQVLNNMADASGTRAQAQDAIAGDPARPAGVRSTAAAEATRLRNDSTDVRSRVGTQSYFRSFCLPKRCQSDTIQVTRGGRINLTFSGPAKSCGNCEVLCQDTTGKWIRQATWNWNVPGSAGFVNGQNQRRIDSGGASNGIYVIHSRSDTFYVKATSINPPLPPNLDTSPSNPETFAGFAVGWTSGTSEEFGAYAEVLRVLSNVDDLGFDLSTAPKYLGPGGVEIIQAHFDVAAQNYWWTEMNLYVGVLGGQAGTVIGFECPDCEIQNGQVALSGGDQEVVLNVGSVNSLGSHYLNLFASSITELDYWGLESAHSTGTPPPVGNLVITRDGNDIRLYWTAVPVAVNYMVQSSPSINGPWTTLTTTASTSYTHLNQANDATTQLYYQVIAVGP